MTTNQRRAVALANDLREGRIAPAALTDLEWMLLLVAADLNRCQSPPRLVANRVLDRAARGVGYFEGHPVTGDAIPIATGDAAGSSRGTTPRSVAGWPGRRNAATGDAGTRYERITVPASAEWGDGTGR